MTNNEEILFGGFSPSGGFRPLPPKIAEFKKPERPPSAFERAYSQLTSTDEGKQLYGDPEKGSTLEQAWRTDGTLHGSRPICLLSRDKPTVPTDAIDRVVTMDSKQLVDTLGDMFQRLGFAAVAAVLYHDGYRGHAIILLNYDRETSRFAYQDGWPGDSLLSKDFNAAGIDAQREEHPLAELIDAGIKQYWTLTSEELKKVIFAALIFPPVWSEYLGEKYYITYDEFKNSHFWSWFQIKEREAHKNSDHNTVISLEPGNFQSEIELHVTLNRKQRLIAGQLNLRRSWIVGPPYGLNLLALDIAQNFIVALIPPLDQQRVTKLKRWLPASELKELLQAAQDPNLAKQLAGQRSKEIMLRALQAYLGESHLFFQPFDYSWLLITSTKINDQNWLQIEIGIYAF
jgi:hypothetical protein